MDLSWYNTWNRINIDHERSTSPSPGSTRGLYEDKFITQWRLSISRQSKMNFYSQLKDTFGEEPYLGLKNRSYRSHIAKMRSSSHDLLIEKGRYGASQLKQSRKVCRFCCSNNNDTMTNFECLPFCEELIIESEEHVLTECPYYHPLRVSLSENLISLLMPKQYGLIIKINPYS